MKDKENVGCLLGLFLMAIAVVVIPIVWLTENIRGSDVSLTSRIIAIITVGVFVLTISFVLVGAVSVIGAYVWSIL